MEMEKEKEIQHIIKNVYESISFRNAEKNQIPKENISKGKMIQTRKEIQRKPK